MESADQAALLQKTGCNHGEGFYFARPLAATAKCGDLVGGLNRLFWVFMRF